MNMLGRAIEIAATAHSGQVLYYTPNLGFEALQYICRTRFKILMEHREINLN